MRKTLLLISFVVLCASVIFESAYSNWNGALSKNTGSPHDGKTCSQTNCHTGAVTTLPNLITSNVPINGYIPGTTYTITATVSDPSLIRFGFEISPQDDAGNLLGTLTITDPTRMHFALGVEGFKYLTHDTLGSFAPSHTNVWSFDWTAPATGTGCVTFYGAFNYANNNHLSTGDVIHTSTLTICEDEVGIDDPSIISSMDIYPNPAGANLELNYYLQKPETVEVNLLDVKGSRVIRLFDEYQNGGAQKISIRLDQKISSGIYLLQLKAGRDIIIKKVVKL